MHRSSVIARSTPSLAHQRVSFQSHGTRVTVRDLFGNLPVRRKSQYLAAINNGDRSKEWEALKKAIVGLLLAWGLEVEVVVRDVEHDRKMVFRCPNHFQPVKNRSDTRSSTSATLISLTQSLFIQASYLPVQSRKSWVSISGSNSSLSINGAISLEPTPTKQFQFMSLGIEPSFADAGNNVLFDEVNRLFSASTFGIVGDDGYEIDERPQEKHPKDPSHRNENYTRMQLKLQKKGVDRWPMFFLKINIGPRAHHNMEGDSSFVKDGDMKAILELLQILVQRFLEEYSFIARTQKPCTVIKPNETPQDSRPSVQFSTPSALRNDNSSPQGGERANLVPEGLQDRLLPLRRRHSNIRLRPRLQTDDLGGGVKLPRLENNRLLDPDIDFGTRSRMKSARSGPYGYTGGMSYEALKRKEQSSESEGNAFPPVPNSSSRRRPRCGEDPGREGSKPTLPDDDWNARMSSGASLSMVQKAYPEKQDDVAAPDTEIHWLNPHTKTPFCFNARIGFIVPPTSSRHHACPLSCGRVRLGGDDVNISINDTSRPSTTAKEHDNELRSCDWIKGVLTEWKNPVFPPTEERIPRLLTGAIEPGHVLSKDGKSCSFPANEKLGEICGPVLPRRISREALRQAKIIAQVDKKFILARLDIEQVNQGSENVISSRQILILVDQHAADERCRVESLLCELCTPSTHEIDTSRSNLGLRSSVNTIMLDKPLKFQISDLEYPLYQVYAAHFARWGILYDLPSMGRRLGDRSETTNLISVKTIPPGVAERCRIEPQLLARLLREEIWHQKELGSSGKDRSGSNMDCSLLASHLAPTHDSEPVVNGHRWSRELSNCPRLLLDMLNSRACRSKYRCLSVDVSTRGN